MTVNISVRDSSQVWMVLARARKLTPIKSRIQKHIMPLFLYKGFIILSLSPILILDFNNLFTIVVTGILVYISRDIQVVHSPNRTSMNYVKSRLMLYRCKFSRFENYSEQLLISKWRDYLIHFHPVEKFGEKFLIRYFVIKSIIITIIIFKKIYS